MNDSDRIRSIGSDRIAILGLLAAYVLSRVLAFWAGVRFDLAPMDTSWQILDPVWLRHDLIESLVYMPGQPPLYNLLLGIVVKLTAWIGGGDMTMRVLFRAIFSALALVTVVGLYAVLRRLGAGCLVAALAAGLFMCSPALILYESLPYYSVIVLALLGVIVWLFDSCMRAFTPIRVVWLFVAMAVLIYTRSLFQVQWFVVLAVFCALVLPGHRRTVLGAAAVPLILILALYAKNFAVVGEFSTSDWMGMSLAKLTTLELDSDTRARLVAEGRLSPLALNDKAFDIPESYEQTIEQKPHTGIEVLDTKRKSTGHINYNYLPYAEISALSRHDALVVIRTHPEVYLRSIGTAWLMFWRPSSDYPFLKANRQAIEPWARGYGWLIGGQPFYPDDPRFDLKPGTIGWLIAIGYGLAVAFGLFVLIRCALRRRVSAGDATIIFVWLNIMYVSVVGNAFEIDENQRFRFAINPMIVMLLITGGYRIAAAWRSRLARPTTRRHSSFD